jgi:transcription elongation GreA/GreB family factor
VSVAFRRDGDEEHLEPKFEIPIPPGPNLVTPDGRALIDAKVEQIAAAVAMLVVNEADQPRIDKARRDLRYWQTRQITAELVPVPSGETVELGTRVAFRHNGQVRELTITGDDEADPAAGRIAFSAPLARALLGAEPDELLAFAGQPDALEVLTIAATFSA